MKTSLMIFHILRVMLHRLHAPVTDERLRNLIKEQIHRGSLKTITETLHDLDIISKVYQFEEEDLHIVECPIIVHFKESENKFVVVVEIHDKQIKYYDPITNKYIQENKSVFFEKWTGTVLIPFTDEQSGDPDYSEHVKEEKQKKLINVAIYTGLSIGVVILLIQAFLAYPQVFFVWLLFFLIKIIAIFVISQIVKIELGESNTFITKICKNKDCGKVLNSKASKLFPWLTMGDVGIIYFGCGILMLIVAPFIDYLTSVVYLLLFLNLFTLPYTIFSICYQRFVLKTWCPFCLSVMGLLWMEFFLGLTVTWTEVFPFSFFLILLFIFAGIAISIGWLIIKRLLIGTNTSASMRMYVNTIKKDTELFKAILSNQDAVPGFKFSPEFILGNEYADNVLIAVISPHCPSCAALYRSIQRFLTIKPDIAKVVLRFNINERDDGWDNQIIDYLYTFNINNMKEKAFSILEEWYGMEYKEINVWKRNCGLENISVSDEAKQLRKNYYNWLLSFDLQGAPVMILNNKLVPRYYTFNDVKYFLKRI